MPALDPLLPLIEQYCRQDAALSAGNIFFCFSLIPMLRHPGKPPLLTCVPTALALLAGGFVFATLHLWVTALTQTITGLQWLALAFKKSAQTASRSPNPRRTRCVTQDYAPVLPNRNGLMGGYRLKSAVGDICKQIGGIRRSTRRALSTGACHMRLISALFAAAALALLLPAPHASAFTIDSASGANSDGTPRFVDPDEQVHSFFFGGSNLNEDGWFDRNAVSPRAAPLTDAPNQSVTYPNLFFPTPPHR